MQYLSILILLAVALAGKPLNLLLIRSDSIYQNSLLGSDGKNLIPNGKNNVKLVLNDDSSLFDTVSHKYVNIGSDGSITLSDSAQKGYSVVDKHLNYEIDGSFGVANGKFAFRKTNSDFLGLSVRVLDSKDIPKVNSKAIKKGMPKTAEKKPFHAQVAQPPQKAEAPKKAGEIVKKPEAPKKAGEIVKKPEAPNRPEAPEEPQLEGIKKEKFGLVAIHSGSTVHHNAIKKVESHPHVFSVGGTEGEDLVLTFGKDKTSLIDQHGRAINLDQNTGELGDVAPFGRQSATTGFSILGGHLAYNGDTSWNACPSGEGKNSLSKKNCMGGIDIALRVM